MLDLHQKSSPLFAHSEPGSGALAERQSLWLVRDSGHFVSRSLAVLPGLGRDDLQMAFSAALTMIEHDDLDELRRLLGDLPALLDFRSEMQGGLSLLDVAASRGGARAVALLAEKGAVLDPPEGVAPLLVAARHRRENAALELLDWGADPACSDPDSGDTPLHYAASQGMELLARKLILAQAPLDALANWRSFDDELGHYTGNSPLHMAALTNQADMAWLLIKADAQRDLSREDGRSPIFYAAARGHVDVLEVLLAAGADPNSRESQVVDEITTDLTPLHYAVLNGHLAAVAMLLCYGADPVLVESNSQTSAYDMACGGGDARMINLFATAMQKEATEGVFSGMDDQMICWQRRHYEEMRPFLDNLLAECPVNSRGLLVLSDWLAEVLGPENRIHLARVHRERETGKVRES